MVGQNQAGRVHFHDNGRTAYDIPCPQPRPVIDHSRPIRIVEEHRLFPHCRAGRIAVSRLCAIGRHRGSRALHDGPDIHQFTVGVERKGVQLLVQAIKPLSHGRQARALQLLPLQFQGEQRALTVIADVDLKAGCLLCARHVFGVKGAGRRQGEFVTRRNHLDRLKL